MDDAAIKAVVEDVRHAPDDRARISSLARAADALDPDNAEPYERAATELAVRIDRMVELARMALDQTGLTPDQRFFFFALGAIRCRRTGERATSRDWVEGADADMRGRHLYSHLRALTYGRGAGELGLGLALARAAHERLRPFAGGAHAIAEFLLEIADAERDDAAKRRKLEEALDYVEEAIGDREEYPRFLYTRGRIQRLLGNFERAREDLRKAIDLEPREAVDAFDRVRDYRVELALVRMNEDTRRVQDAAEKAARKLRDEQHQLQDVVERLRNAEVGVIAAVGFVAATIALVEVTGNTYGNRPFIEVVGIVAAFGVILFGAVAMGAAMLRRRTR